MLMEVIDHLYMYLEQFLFQFVTLVSSFPNVKHDHEDGGWCTC